MFRRRRTKTRREDPVVCTVAFETTRDDATTVFRMFSQRTTRYGRNYHNTPAGGRIRLRRPSRILRRGGLSVSVQTAAGRSGRVLRRTREPSRPLRPRETSDVRKYVSCRITFRPANYIHPRAYVYVHYYAHAISHSSLVCPRRPKHQLHESLARAYIIIIIHTTPCVCVINNAVTNNARVHYAASDFSTP